MHLSPGKHLKDRMLMNGTVTPEEFNYFHEVRLLPYLLPRSALTGYVYVCRPSPAAHEPDRVHKLKREALHTLSSQQSTRLKIESFDFS
jgi:hypothetical protein